jgi:hypothetical protein
VEGGSGQWEAWAATIEDYRRRGEGVTRVFALYGRKEVLLVSQATEE